MVEAIFKNLHFGEIFWNNAPYSVAKIDTSGRFIDANETLRILMGYDKGELNGILFDEVTHSGDLLRDRKLFGDILIGKRTRYSIRKRFITKSGVTILAQSYVYGVFDEAGNLDYMIKMVLPVSGYNSNLWGYVARDMKKIKQIASIIGLGVVALIAQKLFGIDISQWFNK